MSLDKESALQYELLQISKSKDEAKLERIKKGLEYFDFILNDCEGIKDCAECRFNTTEWELIGCTYKTDVNLREMIEKFLSIIGE